MSSEVQEACDEATVEMLKMLGDSRTLFERQTGEIKRYHAWHISREQTVADHVWHVLRIYNQIWGEPTIAVAMTIMFHEDGEFITGDMQHPIKLYVPALKEVSDAADFCVGDALGHTKHELTAFDRWRIKLCDLLEMYEFATRELMAGNQGTGHVVRLRILKAVRAMADKFPEPDSHAMLKREDMRLVLGHIDAVDKWTFYRAT